MSSTYSTNLAIELIGAGDQAGNWGSTTNTNLGTLLEQAISGYTTQAVVTGTDVTLAMTNGASATARNMFIELTGTGGASTNLIVPANKKLYFIYNNTASGQVTVKVSGQTGISVANANKVLLVSNGTDIINATTYLSSTGVLPVVNGGTGVSVSTGTGSVVLNTSPTLVTPILGTPASGTLTNATGLPLTSGVTGTLPVANGGTGVTASTGSGSTVLSTSPTLVTPLLGTPTSGNLANCTFPTLNQNTTGTATNATNILGNSSQAYANNIGSRSINTTYTNSTGKPIWVAVAWTDTGNGDYTATVNGNQAYFTLQDLYPRANVDFVVPIGATYSVSNTVGQTPDYWFELR
jgi:hypothetical protein